MHGLTSERRRARLRHRQQIRRRRFAALALVLTLSISAVIVGSVLPSRTTAHVPAPGAGSPFATAEGVSARIPVARVEGVDMLLPVAREDTTAIAFHPVDNHNTVSFSPLGEQVNSSTTTRLADIFRDGGDLRYYLMSGNGSDESSSTSGLDVGAVPGVFAYSPVQGHVTAVKQYRLLGRYADCEIDIQLTDDPSLLLVVTHLAQPKVKIGDDVKAGQSVLGRVRRFPSDVEQGLRRYTADAGDHLQLVMLRITPTLAGF